jgi:CBS domain containing-hemolysin-like protein
VFDSGIVFGGLGLLLALLLVALNGLFVMAEFAFTRLRATRVESMVREGKASAGLVRDATQNLDAYLAVCQVGITIASLGLGALGEPAVASLLRPLLSPLLPEGLLHTVAFAVAFAIITFLHVTYGELASKTIAIARPEGSARFTAPFMRFFYYLFSPAVWLFNGMANASTRLFGIPAASEVEESHSEEELHTMVGQSGRQGILERKEASRVRALLELDESLAREVMVPKTEVAALPAHTALSELVCVAAEGNRVRYPVCEDGDAARIVGTVHVKDVLRAARTRGGLEGDATAGEIMREVVTVPENRRADRVLDDLRERGLQVAVVIDEWGAFEGIITVEDILERVFGDIREEWEPEPEPTIRELEDGSHAVNGSVAVRDVNDAVGAGFEGGHFGTIGGVVLGALGRAPKVGDEVRLGGYVLRVEETDGARVARIKIQREG